MTQDTTNDVQPQHATITRETTIREVVSALLAADDSMSLRITIDFQRHPGSSNKGWNAQAPTDGSNLKPSETKNRSTGGGGLDEKQPGDSRTSEMKARQ